MTKAHWLRSEIEKLGGMKKNYPMINEPEWRLGYTEAIDDIITRYKEELLELDRKEV